MVTTLEIAAGLIAEGKCGVMVTRLTGPAAGDLTVIDDSGRGLMPGPSLPDEVSGLVRSVLRHATPRLLEAGGDRWFVEPILPMPRLIVCGAIAVAEHLVPLAATAGWSVEVVDMRPWLATPDRFPDAAAVHCGTPIEVVRHLPIDASTSVVSFLHEPRLEDPVLAHALCGPARYVGAMGSRRTTAAKRERLREGGLSDDQVGRLHAPIGLAIGALTPREIAVAVLAEMVASMRGADSGGRDGRDSG